MRSTHRHRPRAAAIGCLAGALLALLPLRSLAAQDARFPATAVVLPPITPGMPLAEALLALNAGGIPLVFSSLVVRADMVVATAPVAREPRALLDELLAPHGLAVAAGEGGTLVVVVAPPAARAALRGEVRSRHADSPVAGAVVDVLETGAATTTDAAGAFAVEALAPGTYTLEVRRPGFVVERHEGVVVPAAGRGGLVLRLQPAPLASDEIAVHPSRVRVLQEDPAPPLALTREEILTLPHLGGDVFRALTLLPGTAGNDMTARLHVRGGRRDEVMVLLDGQELYEAFHLKDFDDALSVVPASGLATLDLTTGAFPASYGDRMGAVLEMSSVPPSVPRRLRFSASIVDALIEASGTAGDATGWLVSHRRGTTDLAAGLFGREENPRFEDLFAKLERRPTAARSFWLEALAAADRLDFEEEQSGELTQRDTSYDSAYVWLTHQEVVGDRLFVDTALSTTRIERDRRGGEDEEEKRFTVRDRRRLDVVGLQQSWNVQASDRHFVQAGFEGRRFSADYDYWSDRAFTSPFAGLRAEPRDGVFAFRDRLRDDYLAGHVSDRWQPLPRLTVELGSRYDHHSATSDGGWSPRASLAWGLGSRSALRLAWGTYRQGQRAYELAVEDGDTRLYPTERSEQWVAGFERLLGVGGPGLSALRAELYRREVGNPRPRYESLFEPLEPFPEGELDRQRIVPERSLAEGVELSLHGRGAERLTWWASYGWARSEDRIDGRDVPRLVDQRHTVNLDVDVRLGRSWHLNAAWRFHTGWPTTAVALAPPPPDDGEDGDGGEPEEEGEPLPVLGPLNGERLPDYHRLDLRLSRRWQLRRGPLTAFADVQNVYDRDNVAGFDLEVDDGVLVAIPEHWPGFFASAGVSWEF